MNIFKPNRVREQIQGTHAQVSMPLALLLI